MTILIDNDEWQAAWGGLELIDVNVDDPVKIGSMYQRLINYNNRWVRYKVTTEIERQGEQPVRYHISYAEEDNPICFIQMAHSNRVIRIISYRESTL